MTLELFAPAQSGEEQLAPGAVVLRGAAFGVEGSLLDALDGIVAAAPFRHMVTPGGHTMSVAMTNCGALGWVTDETGYRYAAVDPVGGAPWPKMPEVFSRLAMESAARSGFAGFQPDACLVNRYAVGARMTLHQDKNERDFSPPIVTVSLGVTAVFQVGGFARGDKAARVRVNHGDVVVFGGPSRMRFHGILPRAAGHHARLGDVRVSLTFRVAG